MLMGPVQRSRRLISFGSAAHIAEDRTSHHADEQQRETDLHAAELKFHGGDTNHEKHEGDREGQRLLRE